MMALVPYDRDAAVAYARRWAMSRNPRYYNFDGLGGDCTNFVSQCIFAGGGVMNHTPTFGWYYYSANSRTPSWTGVIYLYRFLMGRDRVGPMGMAVPMADVMPGDVSQFADAPGVFSHSQMIVSVGDEPGLDNIRICAHTYDSLDRPLSTYNFEEIRFVHIMGSQR
jgi:hypothetical protein